MSEFKTGFAAVIGKPNAGKSTLINTLMKEKISIVSPKPQTTRNSIKCILMGEDYQIILVDTPGIHRPKNKLGEYMMKSVNDTMADVDCILFVVDLASGIQSADENIMETLKLTQKPIILIENKKDRATNARADQIADTVKKNINVKSVIQVSAKDGKNTESIIPEILKYIPYGPMLYDPDYLTDQSERFVVSEMIREKAIMLLSDEIPYGIGVEVIKMTQRSDKPITDIEATIFCERESHKGIIIGKGGAMLKQIGSRSREDIENMLSCKVNLRLWVKVREDWRNDGGTMRSLGYK